MSDPRAVFKVGDRVEILEAYRDPGDEEFLWIVVGAEEKGRVEISPVNTGLPIPPIHQVQAGWIRYSPEQAE